MIGTSKTEAAIEGVNTPCRTFRPGMPDLVIPAQAGIQKGLAGELSDRSGKSTYFAAAQTTVARNATKTVETSRRHLVLDRHDDARHNHPTEAGNDPPEEAGRTMVDWNECARHYVDQLGGSEEETAYHRLIEADNAVVPVLMGAFRTQQNPAVRALLVDIIWQHRLPETVGFLIEALDDRDPEVWKSALDGLVTLGPLAIQALRSARERIFPATQEERTRAEWIDEAIQQIQEGT